MRIVAGKPGHNRIIRNLSLNGRLDVDRHITGDQDLTVVEGIHGVSRADVKTEEPLNLLGRHRGEIVVVVEGKLVGDHDGGFGVVGQRHGGKRDLPGGVLILGWDQDRTFNDVLTVGIDIGRGNVERLPADLSGGLQPSRSAQLPHGW